MDRLEEAMSSFAMCNATDCYYNDGAGCTCYTVDLIKRKLDGNIYVVCADYEQRKEEE